MGEYTALTPFVTAVLWPSELVHIFHTLFSSFLASPDIEAKKF